VLLLSCTGFVNGQIFGGGGGGGKLEQAAKVTHSPGGMTITPRGSIILSLHQYQKATERVVEIPPNGDVLSFPNAAISRGEKNAPFVIDAVLGLQCDKHGVVWMLDNGRRSEEVPKIIGWDSGRNKLVKIIYLPAPATRDTSFINDLVIDPQEPFIYITDPASGRDCALISVNLETGLSRRLLEGHTSVIPEDIDIIVDGHPITVKRPDGSFVKPMAGAGPIAIDHKGNWVYFGPMAGRMLYRIRAEHLRDTDLSPEDLKARVEEYAAKPPGDGIAMDSKDNIYTADAGGKAIGVIRASTKKYEVYKADERFLWPDGLCFGNDGYLYFYASQLNLLAAYNAGRDRTEPPYHIYKLKALSSGTVGH
jgi:sugar lactone lactonase YvrE